MRQKTRIFIYILIAVAAVIMGTLAILENHQTDNTVSAQEHIDLGRIYLTELSYEKAVLEFTEAIEIEPLNADAYLGLAEAYVGMGDTEKAAEVLEEGYGKTGDERIKDMLEKLHLIISTVLEETSDKIDGEKSKFEEVFEMYIPYEVKTYSDNEHYFYNGNTVKDSNNYYVQFNKIESNNEFYCDFYSGQSINHNEFSNRIFSIYGTYGNKVYFHFYAYNSYYILPITYYNGNDNIMQQVKNVFDFNENIISNISDSRNELKFEYDNRQNLIKIIYPYGECIIFDYDLNGNLLCRKDYDNNDDEFYREDYTYDINGNCTSRSYSGTHIIPRTETYTYDLNGNILKYDYDDTSYYTYEYDQLNRVLNRIKYTVLQDGTILQEQITYSYDSKNRITGEIRKRNYGDTDDNFVYSYNSNDKIEKKKETLKFNSGGCWIYETDYIYDKNDNLIETVNKHSRDSRIFPSSNTKYTYNENGCLLKIEEFCNGELIESEEYKYIKVELPMPLVRQIKEKYGIDLTE